MEGGTDSTLKTEGILQAEDFATPEEYRVWATVMLGVYAAKAAEDIAASEKLIADGIERREQALSIIDRAQAISRELARFLDEQTGIDVEINW